MINTKQHYDFTAKILRNARPDLSKNDSVDNKVNDIILNVWRELVLEFAKEFKNDNPRFNIDIFLTECGYKG